MDLDFIMRYENGDPDLTNDEVITAFQAGINDGSVWKLQGSYGRKAHDLILAGLCTPTGQESVDLP